jgi:TRAP-type mannitol/chloroaromatic compound transport system permease large subunit
MFVIYIAVRCRFNPQLGPSLAEEERQMDLGEKSRLLAAGILPLVIIFSVTGLFMIGVTSLVESSAMGAAAATIAAIAKRRLTRKVMDDTLHKTLCVSCMFMRIVLAALCFGAVFDGLGAVHAIETLFLDKWRLSPWGVFIMMQVTYILMGMFLDDTAMFVIVAPLDIPLVITLGFNPIWYGVSSIP